MKFKRASLFLTPEEYEELLAKGSVHIDDPERGEIDVRLHPQENHIGVAGRQGMFTVIRPGTAAIDPDVASLKEEVSPGSD